MCGIAGYFVSHRREPVRRDILEAMNAAIVHRGPDQNGIYQSEFAGLTSRRLAIIDLKGGRQPIANENGNLRIVFNGEIYNHHELRRDLETRGHTFRTATDTEVILHLYEEFGVDALERLNGMFAFAIWNEAAQRLFLARDRLGIKPLFYQVHEGTVSFGSEIKALLAGPGPAARLDPQGISEYLFCGLTVSERTLFDGIQPLGAGCWLEADANGVQVDRFWRIHFGAERNATEETLVDELADLLSDSVTRELDSDAPLGCCLSGGLDSSLVTALAARTRPGISAFTIGYEANTALFRQKPARIVGEVVGDDWDFAHRVAATVPVTHRAEMLPVDDILGGIDRMILHREKPLITLSEYGHLRLCEAVRPHCKVLLSGQGADELFGGYYYWWQFRSPETTDFFPWVFRTATDNPSYPATAIDWFQFLTAGRPDLEYSEAHTARFQELMREADGGDFFNRLSYLLLKTHLHEMLELEDRHGMASSIELRVPFLDHRIVEWALRLPGSVKAEGRVEKALLRRMVRQRVKEFPTEVAERRKSPMPPPFDIDELVSGMVAELEKPGLAVERWFGRSRLERLLTHFRNAPSGGRVSQRHYALFTIYFLERWHRLFNV